MRTNSEKENTPSLNEYVYEEIKNQILIGAYPPGAKLVTKDLAEKFRVSRTPVIVAVNRLAAEGLATAIPQQGVFVKQRTLKEIHDILEIRKMIEVYSVPAVIRTMSFDHETTEKLRATARKFTERSPENYDQAIDLEVAFHTQLIGTSGNEEMVRVFQNEHCMDVTLHLYQRAGMDVSDIQKAKGEHEIIVDELEAGNAEKVTSLLIQHLDRPLDLLNWLITTGRLSHDF